MKNKLKFTICGIISGLFNGFFGAGGGILIVPLLEKLKITPKKAHATSILIILIMSIFSLGLYIYVGNVKNLVNFLIYIPPGLFGALVGAKFIKKINPKILKTLFNILILISSVRLFLK